MRDLRGRPRTPAPSGPSTLINPGVGVVPTQDPRVAPETISRPQPSAGKGTSDAPVSQIAWEQLIAQNAATQQLLDKHDELVEIIGRLTKPAELETVVLTATSPVFESREKWLDPVRSIGIVNFNPITVYFSTVGSASPNTRSPAVPANCLMVLPISAQSIEIGAAAADVANSNAVVLLLRFSTVQPAFIGKSV